MSVYYKYIYCKIMIKSTKKVENSIVREDLPLNKDVSVMDTFVGQSKEMVNDRIVKNATVEEFDARDNFKDYKVSDFYMENLEAAGAVPTKTVQYYDGDIDKVLNYVDGLNESVSVDE